MITQYYMTRAVCTANLGSAQGSAPQSIRPTINLAFHFNLNDDHLFQLSTPFTNGTLSLLEESQL